MGDYAAADRAGRPYGPMSTPLQFARQECASRSQETANLAGKGLRMPARAVLGVQNRLGAVEGYRKEPSEARRRGEPLGACTGHS